MAAWREEEEDAARHRQEKREATRLGMRRVKYFFIFYFLRTNSARGGGGGGGLPGLFFFSPCSAGKMRDWPPCKVVFFGLATNALNVRNNNNKWYSNIGSTS